MDKLALTWSIGIGVGYAFLVSFICWIGYRCFLIYTAYQTGDFLFIVTELKTDLFISTRIFWHRDNPPENGIYLIPEERVFGSDLPWFSQVNKKNAHIWWFCCVCG